MGLRHYALIVAGAFALAEAYPGTNAWQLAWVALVPLILTLDNRTPRHSLIAGTVFGIAFIGTHVAWITLFGYLPWIALVIFQSLFFAVFSLLASVIMKNRFSVVRVLGIAAAWAAVEWFRSLGPVGFTWGDLAYSQAYNLPIARLANITGPWGVSFLIVLANAGIVEMLRARHELRKNAIILLPLALMAVVAGWGSGQHSGKPVKPLRVSAVQACIEQSVHPAPGGEEKTWQDNLDLTDKALESRPDFIVWPESAILEDIEQSPYARSRMEIIARSSSADIITGYVHETSLRGEPREQNGAAVITPHFGLQDHYYKVKLVPFGEYVPARKWLGFTKGYGVREIDYIPGPGWNTLESSHGRIGTVICFESTFPQISRILIRRGAGLLFILTNDAWLERTAAAEQHLQMGVFRAIENDRYVVRSTTSGISAVIAPDGSIRSILPSWKFGVMNGEVEMRKGLTPYTRFGDWAAYACVGIAVLICLSGVLCGRKTKGRNDVVATQITKRLL